MLIPVRIFSCSLPRAPEVVDGTVAVADVVLGAGGDGRGDVVLGLGGGGVEVGAEREVGGYGRRQRASGAVGIDRIDTGRTQLQRPAGLCVVEDVRQTVVREMAGLSITDTREPESFESSRAASSSWSL